MLFIECKIPRKNLVMGCSDSCLVTQFASALGRPRANALLTLIATTCTMQLL